MKDKISQKKEKQNNIFNERCISYFPQISNVIESEYLVIKKYHKEEEVTRGWAVASSNPQPSQLILPFPEGLNNNEDKLGQTEPSSEQA